MPTLAGPLAATLTTTDLNQKLIIASGGATATNLNRSETQHHISLTITIKETANHS